MENMECPDCGLYSCDDAMRCDCVYDFEAKIAEELPLVKQEPEGAEQDGSFAKSRKRSLFVIIISVIILCPVLLAVAIGMFILIEEVFGYNEISDGPEWIVEIVAFVIIGIGFFLWSRLAPAIESRLGRRDGDGL
ncbi:MAG: hypothetical protein KAS88_01065 [Deltaproteobacteria bacterium]|nr:hypothetical protein [Deltaproteobacteria bacterium]